MTIVRYPFADNTTVRASIEDEYARKLLAICRKPLGTCETGSLRSSLDVVRGETEAIAKSHAAIASQMKVELEEPLGAFASGIKERRKIIQNTIERLHKTKMQQTAVVNKVSLPAPNKDQTKANIVSLLDKRSIRTGLPPHQGLPGTRPYGHGPGGAQEQGEA